MRMGTKAGDRVVVVNGGNPAHAAYVGREGTFDAVVPRHSPKGSGGVSVKFDDGELVTFSATELDNAPEKKT